MVDNNVLIAKADLALSSLTSNGGLKPDEVRPFIVLMVTPRVFLRRCRIEDTSSPTLRIPNLRFTGRVFAQANSGQALAAGARSAPTLGQNTADVSRLIRAEFIIPDEIAEDNVDGEVLLNKIREAAAQAGSKDVEDLVINGDTTIAPATDVLLGRLDGLLKKTTVNTLALGTIVVSKDVWTSIELTMPAEFSSENYQEPMQHFTSRKARKNYGNYLAARVGAYGDKNIQDSRGYVEHDGVEVVGVPVFPETQGVGTNCTSVLHMDANNAHVVFHREIKMETQRDASAGAAKMVMTARVDVVYENDNAAVLATQLKVTT